MLANAHVVNEHLLRKERCRVGAAGPGSAYRNIEQDEEGMRVNPRGARWDIVRSFGGIERIVNVPANHVLLPLDRKDVKSIADGSGK